MKLIQNTPLMYELREFIIEWYPNEIKKNFRLDGITAKEIFWTQVDKDTIEVHVTYLRRQVYTFDYELERIA